MVRSSCRSKVNFMDLDTRRRRRGKQMAMIRRCERNDLLRGLEISRKHQPRKQHSRKHLISCLKGFSSLVGGVLSHDNNLLLKATIQFCELLSTEQKPPIKRRIQLKLVSRFVKLLEDDFPPLQCEAAWALANIAYGTSKGTEVVMKMALPTLVNLLYSTNADVREQVVFALGVVACHSTTFRDLVLSHGVLERLLDELNMNPNSSMLRNASWTLSNICRGRPPPSFAQVRPALKTLKRLLHNDDWEVLSDSCLALSYLSHGSYDQIEEVVGAGVCPELVQLLYCSSSSVVISALHAIGNIVSGNHSQVKVILELEALPYLLSLLTDKVNNNFVKKEADKDIKFMKNRACFVISNITCGSRNQIQAVIEAGLIEPLVELLKTADVDACVRGADTDTCVRAAKAIFNAAYSGSCEQIKHLASKGCIEALCNLVVHSSDPSILCTCLDGLCCIMENGGTRVHTELIRSSVGLERIQVLTDDKNKHVARKALSSLMCVFFSPQGAQLIDV